MSVLERVLQEELADWSAADAWFCAGAGIVLDVAGGSFTSAEVLDGVGRESGGVREQLRACLAELGVAPAAVELFAVAAETAGALATGADLSTVAGTTGAAAVRPGAGKGGGETGVGAADLDGRVTGASEVLGLVGALTGLSAHLDGALLGVVSELTVRNGRVLLARRGVADPGELTVDQVRRWRGRAKTTTRREIAALTGWGEGEVADLVALANAPAPVADPVRDSMDAGVSPWRLARRFLREFGHRAHEDAADVARSLFGTDPGTACTERLDPDGHVKDGPWEHRMFYRAVDAASARLDSADPQAGAEQRARVRERRDVRCSVDADGSGSVTVHGTATQVAAVADRVEKAARAARAAGERRTLAQLRADVALSLLLHSSLALPEEPAPEDRDDPRVRVAWTAQLRKVLAAMPAAVLNVIVPFDSLIHSPTRPVLAGPPAAGAAFFAPPDHGVPPGADPPGAAARPGAPPGDGQVRSVGMVTGAFPFFITPDAVRELALAPGTTLYRLLTDPADGRCVERSIASYAPDAAMRAQVHAADVTCRAPGCDRHAPYTQLDHVVPFGTDGGDTREANLQDLHTGHHDPKTQGEWTAVMATNRDITWTSLLGRIYRTRAHDYRQYSTLYRQALDRVETDVSDALDADRAARDAARAQGSTGMDGRGERRDTPPLTRQRALADAVDAAIYRALTYRGPGRALRAGDDHPDTDTDPAYLGWDIIDLTHVSPSGRRRHGPDPDTANAERDAHHATRPRPATKAAADPEHHQHSEQGRPGAPGQPAPDEEPPPF